MLATSVSTIRTPAYPSSLFLSAILGAGMLGTFHANSIAITGPGFGLEATALTGLRSLRAYVSGHNIALAVIAVPLLAVVSFGLAAFAGHPADGFWVVAIDFGGIGAGLAISSICTVTLAYPAEKRVGSPIPGAASGSGGQAFAAAICSIAGCGWLATVPVILAAQFTHSAVAAIRLPVLVLCAAGYGFALAWMGVADRRAHRRPEGCRNFTRSPRGASCLRAAALRDRPGRAGRSDPRRDGDRV